MAFKVITDVMIKKNLTWSQTWVTHTTDKQAINWALTVNFKNACYCDFMK
jgi:hypothetical protein